MPISKEPFKGIRFPNNKKVRGLKDKVESFSLFQSSAKLYRILSEIYDTQLRNAYSHNEYKILIRPKQIELTRYRRKITFTKFEKIYEGVDMFHHAVLNRFYQEYHVIKYPDFPNWGIEGANLGYTDPIIIDGQLYPDGDAIPELDVLQYWCFAFKINDERYIPVPKITVSNKSKLINFKFGRKNVLKYPLDDEGVQRWLSFVIANGGYVLTLLTIAPKMPVFNNVSEQTIPLGSTGVNVNVLNHTEKFIKLPLKLLKEVSDQITS